MLYIGGKEASFFSYSKQSGASPDANSIYGFASPGVYLQGCGLIEKLPEYAGKYGERFLFIITNSLFDRFSSKLAAFSSAYSPFFVRFSGVCCEDKVNEIRQQAASWDLDVVVGIGGGNLMDTAKLVACQLDIPLILMPSVGSCDAATSGMSILYTNDGIFRGSIRLPKRAEMIVVDTDIILNSPVRLFVSGIGDALATYFEARAGLSAGSLNYIEGGCRSCKLAQVISKASYDILISSGREALASFKNGIMDDALNAVIENNIFLSGLGFENSSCALAHGLHSALAFFEQKKTYHGEKVSFGLICQLVLEGCPDEELQAVFSFAGI